MSEMKDSYNDLWLYLDYLSSQFRKYQSFISQALCVEKYLQYLCIEDQ